MWAFRGTQTSAKTGCPLNALLYAGAVTWQSSTHPGPRQTSFSFQSAGLFAAPTAQEPAPQRADILSGRAAGGGFGAGPSGRNRCVPSRGARRVGWVGLLLAGWTALAGLRETRPEQQTALDRYVAAPDENYRFEVVQQQETTAGTVYCLKLTSQSWRSPSEVNRTIWEHWLLVAVPREVRHQTGLLFIGGGRNQAEPPSNMDGNLARLAVETRSVVAELRNVPNQPLVFHGDGQERVEDDLIAYTWDQFLRTGDERWPARLPMTKAAVRAMDAITAFCAGSAGGGHKVDRFVVAGASKRGWTTWTTAAVDDRVVAIVPVVIDVLNVEASMQHHYAAYGFWAPAVGDYVRHGIMNWMGSREMRALLAIEDPYSYRSRLTMPKLILNAAGDQFFLPDSSRFYFDDLPGEKLLRYVPNADHSLRRTDAFDTLKAFYGSILEDRPRPRLRWHFGSDGLLEVVSETRPLQAQFWQATNPEARDFRLETFGTNWSARPLTSEDGHFSVRIPEPDRGWTAALVELTYAGPLNTPFKLTTPVFVRPDRTLHRFIPDAARGTR